MDYFCLVQSLPKSMIEEFELATRNGCWKSGIPMTARQMEICREVVAIARSNPEMLPAEKLDVDGAGSQTMGSSNKPKQGFGHRQAIFASSYPSSIH